ncbi:mitochondrial 54S ribosomal protein YmL24/YmL14 [Saccharomycopsis crataegensis]|uniref:Large ribosomal subunit protein bL28m n=1 Tax=Saccharomycopsis crataegensis TaxID=43959 RepID=A0AAV5QGA6_9ASCO|nr:mitochondrial 54S ribosomal protein YmL24/YmL14 [Saccharomycopsis crataegensis]
MLSGLAKIFPSTLRGTFQFSTSSVVSREWKTIEARRVAKVELPNLGEKIPAGLYIPKEKPEFPEYKYGESRIFKRSNKGLFGGRFLQFGNQISEKSKHKTRRTWQLNIMKKKFWSEALQRTIRINVATKVLRTITKEGGIDNYLTKDKPARIKELGPSGWKLRFRVLMKRAEAENPKKNYLETVQVGDKEIPVYFKVEDQKITVGRRKLLKTIYGLELESNTELSFRDFMLKYRDEPVEKLLQQLQSLNYDVAQITV